MHQSGEITRQENGQFAFTIEGKTQTSEDKDAALEAVETALTVAATAQAQAAGVLEVRTRVMRELNEVPVGNQMMFMGASIKVTAYGRPRIAAS